MRCYSDAIFIANAVVDDVGARNHTTLVGKLFAPVLLDFGGLYWDVRACIRRWLTGRTKLV